MRYLFVLVFVFSSSVFSALFAQNTSWQEMLAQKKGHITVTYFPLEPFNYKNSQGKLEGIEHDLMMEFVKFTEKKFDVTISVEFEEAKSFKGLYEKVRIGSSGIFGSAALSITPQRQKEINFTPRYIPDVEVLICSENVVLVNDTANFIQVFRNLTGIYVPHSTVKSNIDNLRKYIPNFTTDTAESFDDIKFKLSNNDNLFSYTDLPSYLIGIENGMKIRRQRIFQVKNSEGYGIIFPKGSDWDYPIQSFFEDESFIPTLDKIIEKYLGDGVHEIMDIMSDDPATHQYSLAGMEREIQLLRVKEKELENNQRNVLLYSLMGVIFLILIILVILWVNNRRKNKVNQILRKQNQEINQQKEEILSQRDRMKTQTQVLEGAVSQIDKKNKQITDSIRYAKQIQTAMLPFKDRMDKAIPEYFILFKPKDIVSGDFYWFMYRNGKIYLAAVDCTGHGVPGAFMSLIGNQLLDHIVNENKLDSPELILNELHKRVRIALNQDQGQNDDGMDISLCVIDPKTRKLHFAGAKSPICYIKDNELVEIKGNKKPVGGPQKEVERLFTKHTIEMEDSTTFYLFSDGYQDQFGHSEHKKYMNKRFREFLFSISYLPMEEQHIKLDAELENWKGETIQTDDILVAGFRM
jgi:serine phosphatase RsbU (regulator of sigma subunit)